LQTQDSFHKAGEGLLLTETVLKTNPVSVSVGICATVELESTMQLVNQILNLDDDGIDVAEVIVATPNPLLAENLTGPDARVITIQEERREGKVSALNKIIERASGDVLVLASADIKIAKSTLPRLVHGLVSGPERGAVDSQVELVNGDRLLMDRVSNLLWDIHNSTLDLLDGSDRLGHVAGDLLAVRRELVSALPMVINDDAYLAMKVREKGLLVKRVPNALVWICGPRNAADYVRQRSRVLSGHLQLIEILGRLPSTFEFEVARQPRRSLRILVGGVSRQGPSSLWPMFVAGFLELVSFGVAILSRLVMRRLKPWRIVHSTKKL
jgi:poly-beta-1,6-N-acetyl-D-glucosamine synthase